jgi:hypothetical protein
MLGSVDAAAALLLAAAGLGKVFAPATAAAMLGRSWQRLRSVRWLPSAVRLIGVAELGIGLAVLIVGDRISFVLLACCYAAFALVAVRLTRAGQRASCGCFGRAESPVGRAHVVLDHVCVAAAVDGAIWPSAPLGDLFADDVMTGAIGAAQVSLLAWLGFLSITALPALAADRRRVLEAR